MTKQFPVECEEYIAQLPPPWQNNLRTIVRNDFKRILKLNPMVAQIILNAKYGLSLDCDRTAADYADRSVVINEQ